MNRMKTSDLATKVKPIYSAQDVELVKRAAELATKAHRGQKRDSGKPYVDHPLSVASLLVDWGMDLDSVLAGVLHDVIEDTDTELEVIKKEFGDSVAQLVDGLTKVGHARSGMKHLGEYKPQTTDNLSKLLIATASDIRVIIVKLADRLHNLTELQYKSPDKQQKIARESLDVFGPMADQIGMGQVRTQIEDLAFSYLDPKRYKFLQNLTRKNLSRSTRKLGKIKLEVDKALKENGLKFEINGRIKSIYSLHKKMVRKDENIDDIHDLIALRVLVDSKEDCYRVLGILHTLYQPLLNRIKDYIAVPKANGYQSLHTTVITPHKQIVEFQIRTHEMHDFAEHGLAASFHYNDQKLTKNYTRSKGVSRLPASLQWITELQEVAARLKDDPENIDSDQLAIDLFKDRIFVYSPKGDIFNLPDNALPLDFAYSVHSNIAGRATGFRINNKIAPFDQRLMNGDVVEVITSKTVNPKADWLDLIVTSHAKQKLRAQLKKAGISVKTSLKSKNKPKRRSHI